MHRKRGEGGFPKHVHVTETDEIVLKIAGCLLNKRAGCFGFVFSLSSQQEDNVCHFDRKSFGFLALPIFWQLLKFQNNCGNLYVQRP